MASFIVEKSFAKSFGFRPSVSYVQKGQALPKPNSLVDKYYLALRYVEFNPDILYYVGGNEGGFFIGASPSIAFNLPSKRVSETDGVKTTNSIEFGREGTAFMRGTDWGANFTAGFRSKSGFLFNLSYNRGFRNLAIEGDPGELRNSYFGVQIGVFLNNGKDSK